MVKSISISHITQDLSPNPFAEELHCMGHIQNTILGISKLFHRHKKGNETPGALQNKERKFCTILHTQ